MTRTLSVEEIYVNMADVISESELSDQEMIALIELLFFAYRDFVSDPDQVLADIGFGRAHHRVVHFIGRDPGMTVQQLLDLLRITKQSLARVLKDLIEQNFVVQKEGESDRRQRLLFLTPAGTALQKKLMAPQLARVRRAAAHPQANLRAGLLGLIDPENHSQIELWLKNRAQNG
jgi:DNA-binding MarR family transcriptional regulator